MSRRLAATLVRPSSRPAVGSTRTGAGTVTVIPRALLRRGPAAALTQGGRPPRASPPPARGRAARMPSPRGGPSASPPGRKEARARPPRRDALGGPPFLRRRRHMGPDGDSRYGDRAHLAHPRPSAPKRAGGYRPPWRAPVKGPPDGPG